MDMETDIEKGMDKDITIDRIMSMSMTMTMSIIISMRMSKSMRKIVSMSMSEYEHEHIMFIDMLSSIFCTCSYSSSTFTCT